MNDSSHIEGLKLLALHDPSTICINGSLAERTTGIWSIAMLSCTNIQQDGGPQDDKGPVEWPLTMKWSKGDTNTTDMIMNLLSVVAGLESCGAIKGYYTPHELRHALDTEQAISQIKGDNPNNTELYRKVDARNVAHISTVVGMLKGEQRAFAEVQKLVVCPSYNNTISPSQAVLRLVGSETAALLRSGRPHGYEIESRLYMASDAPFEGNNVCFTKSSSSAWKGRDLVLRVVGKNWLTSSMWLHLHQDGDTAKCVLDFLQNSVRGAQEKLAHCSNSFLTPREVLPYSCSKGVDDTAMQKAEEFILIAKRRNTVSFLFMQDLSSDDVYAIYTGALGSVFAAVACVAATAVLVIVVLVWRVLFGTGTDVCRCGIVQRSCNVM